MLLGAMLLINPLAAGLSYFALDNVLYHGRSISVAWDADGTRNYPGCPKGMCVYVDGKVVATSPTLARVEVKLPDRVQS